jgi:hypothetical protein
MRANRTPYYVLSSTAPLSGDRYPRGNFKEGGGVAQPAPACFDTKTVSADPKIVYGQYLARKNASEAELVLDTFGIPGKHMIVDLSHSRKCSAYYHRLVDCFLPSLCAFMHGVKQPSSTFIVPPFMSEIYGIFLADSRHRPLLHNGNEGLNRLG